MPIFFQHKIDENTRLGVWKIEETEEFFKGNVPQHRDVTHPHKRLQHLAGRFLLQYLFPDFPFELIQIADTRKPFLPDEQYHFSISHCGDYAATIVSRNSRVGIDIEIPTSKVETIMHKFLNREEKQQFYKSRSTTHDSRLTTLLWSAKESVFKWYGDGGVDFREHIHLLKQHEENETIECFFSKTNSDLTIHYRQFEHLVLAWVLN
ncbi:MAG: 4'-phosphopantetheinyl transferase superfamily protein [Sphingobacteriales bacterium]|nr:4'-phosphopantetheinyl transferase superfamily protein [Sphingobacteriales bacterium]